MNTTPDYPQIKTMASGERSIAIAKCSYEEFPDCSRFWAAKLGAQILKSIDGPDQRLLIVEIERCLFWLAFDEFASEISLEPKDSTAGKIIPSIFSAIELTNS